MRRLILALLLVFATSTITGLALRARTRVQHAAPPSQDGGAQSAASPRPLILQWDDGEHLVRRPGGPNPGWPFTIKVDGQNGNAQDFFVLTDIMEPGQTIPFHKHHNAEEILILEEGGATVTVGEKRAVAGPHAVVFLPRDTWISVTNTGTQSIHLYAIFSRQGFERYMRAISVAEGQPVTPLNPEDLPRLRATGHATNWDTSKGPYPPAQSAGSARPLILQWDDGEHLVRRPGGPNPAWPFTIKVDGQNGNALDFYVLTEIMAPGQTIPFHKHHNAEEILILEEGGATVTVGDKRAVAGPHAVVFLPPDTWISVTNTGTQSIHLYALFSRQGFERYQRAASVAEGQPVTPLNPEELPRLRASGHATYWDTSKGPYPPGVPHP